MYFKVDYLLRGKLNSTIVEAQNRFEASSLVKKSVGSSIVVVSTKETSAPVEEILAGFLKSLNSIFHKGMPIDEKISNIRQIAVMTDAGIPIYDVLEDIVSSSKNPVTKEIFSSIAHDINAGKSMSQALEPFREEMGHIVMAMTKLGETTGNFPEAYHKLADILETIRDNKAKFKKAMRYPITVIIALVIAFVTVIMTVVPKFRKIFENLGADLPIATKFLLGTEDFFRHYGYFIIGGLVAGFFIIKYLYQNNEDFKYNVDRVLANPKFYLIGEVVYLATMYNYTLVLGTLIKSGIPVSEALETALGVIDNSYLKKQLESINVNIGRGIGLSEAVEQTGLFENMTIQMIRAGESSGQLDQMLDKVSGYYNMKFQNIIDNLSAYIEPIMIALIAGLVLLLALGIFMPMWDLGKAAKGG